MADKQNDNCAELTAQLHTAECQLADLREKVADLRERVADCSYS